MAKSNIAGTATWHATIERCEDNVGDDTTTFWNNTGVKIIDRTAYLKNAPTFDGNVTVTGTSTLTGAVTCSATLGVTGAATCSSTLGVTGAAVFSSTLGVTGALSCSSTISGASLSVTGDVTAGSDGSGSFKMGSRAVTRSAASLFVIASTGVASVEAVTVANGDAARNPVDLPHGAVLTKATFTVDPANATPPAGVSVTGEVFKVSLSTGASTSIVSTEDPTAGASYGALHTFDTATVSETIDRTAYTYHLRLLGESGGGASTCVWYATSWTANVTGIDDGVA
jgi:hypothetical protein